MLLYDRGKKMFTVISGPASFVLLETVSISREASVDHTCLRGNYQRCSGPMLCFPLVSQNSIGLGFSPRLSNDRQQTQ